MHPLLANLVHLEHPRGVIRASIRLIRLQRCRSMAGARLDADSEVSSSHADLVVFLGGGWCTGQRRPIAVYRANAGVTSPG